MDDDNDDDDEEEEEDKDGKDGDDEDDVFNNKKAILIIRIDMYLSLQRSSAIL